MSTPEIRGGGVLGEKVKDLRRMLDVFELPVRTRDVRYVSDEVSSLCPITGQPDWYTVEIQIQNAVLGIESKSLKLYLQSFREDGQFCEAFADTICKDVFTAISQDDDLMVTRGRYPRVSVIVTQKPRGGVSIVSLANQKHEGGAF